MVKIQLVDLPNNKGFCKKEVNLQGKYNQNKPQSFNNQVSSKYPSSELLQVYFGNSVKKSDSKIQLEKILAEKIAENGKITPEMIDTKIAKLLFLVSTEKYKNAYAPYSNFKVGAAVITEKGNIFEGVNIENVTYNSNLHGETTAISNMIINEGSEAKIAASATCSDKLNPATSCGSCRQNIAEFSRSWDTKLITARSLNPENEDIIIDRLGDMLPNGFSPSILREENIK